MGSFNKNTPIILTILIAIYIILKALFNFSLIGVWTEIICLIIFVYFTFKTRHKTDNGIIKGIVCCFNSLYVIVILLYLIGTFLGTLYRNDTFYFIEVENRLFNAYVYRPFALPPTSDKLTISETSIFYPFLEIPKWYEGKFIDFEVIETDGNGTKDEKIATLKRHIQYMIKNENKK